MTWRFALLLAVITVAWLALFVWERRAIPVTRSLRSGLTLVTGADCRLCPFVVAAADDAGIPVSIIDVADVRDSSIRSIPTVLVADADGRVIARRSGRSAVTGMPELISLARSVA